MHLNWMNFPYPTRRFVGTKRKGLKSALSAEKRGGEIGAGKFFHFLNQSLDQEMDGILQVLQPQRETRQPLLHNFAEFNAFFGGVSAFARVLPFFVISQESGQGVADGLNDPSCCANDLWKQSINRQEPWYFSLWKMTCKNNQSTDKNRGTFLQENDLGKQSINRPTTWYFSSRKMTCGNNQSTDKNRGTFLQENDLWKQSINQPRGTVVLFFTENVMTCFYLLQYTSDICALPWSYGDF